MAEYLTEEPGNETKQDKAESEEYYTDYDRQTTTTARRPVRLIFSLISATVSGSRTGGTTTPVSPGIRLTW
jgi:hypothetical protein